MRKLKRILFTMLTVMILMCFVAQPVFALEESEVQAQVEAVGKEAVAGNVLIWFLCAIAFLKVSQKIDSFMSSLGIFYCCFASAQRRILCRSILEKPL